MDLPDISQLSFDDFPQLWCKQLDSAWLPIATRLADCITNGQKLIGIHGGQGSGKSTLARGLQLILKQSFKLNVAILSIDDFYLTRQQRSQLAEDIHPLLMTRGVPGTHDMAHLDSCVNQLLNSSPGQNITIPVFNKLADDRAPVPRSLCGPFDAVIVEGWCIATPAQPTHLLANSCNTLEVSEDQEGIWRHWVNDQLQKNYQPFFAKLQRLVMLKVPSVAQIIQWRTEQEEDNRRRVRSNKPSADSADVKKPNGMTAGEIIRFVQHYERLTLWSLETLPKEADILVNLDKSHAVASVNFHASLL